MLKHDQKISLIDQIDSINVFLYACGTCDVMYIQHEIDNK